MTQRPSNQFANYHAHVYFDQDTLAAATTIVEQAGAQFDVQVGRIHQRPVGPHPRWSCQIAFDAATFDELIPWLDARRGDLTVFVHGLTGDDLADHTTGASWLGDPAPLKLEMFRKSARNKEQGSSADDDAG